LIIFSFGCYLEDDGLSAKNLAGEYFIATGSGKYFKNVILGQKIIFASFNLMISEMPGALFGVWKMAVFAPANFLLILCIIVSEKKSETGRSVSFTMPIPQA